MVFGRGGVRVPRGFCAVPGAAPARFNLHVLLTALPLTVLTLTLILILILILTLTLTFAFDFDFGWVVDWSGSGIDHARGAGVVNR
jgi:hypothetical protein